jgi:flagellar biosynthesis anti-sigma factor FlgM
MRSHGASAFSGAQAKSPIAAAPKMASDVSGVKGNHGLASSRELRGLVRDMAASPPVDTAKIDRLRTEISGGAFKPNPDAIAGAMIAQETSTAPKA